LTAATLASPDADARDPQKLWAERVGRRMGLLPESLLTIQTRAIDAVRGREYLLNLDPGRHTVLDVVRALPKIAAALERRVDQIAVEPDPGGVHCLCRFIVADDSALTQPTHHPGAAALNPATGTVDIGVHVDGEPAQWTLWNDRGAYGGAVIGDGGAGGTNVMRGLLAAVVDCELVSPWAIDVNGLNLTGVPAAARVALTLEEAHAAITEAYHIGMQRAALMVGSQPVPYRPNPDNPLTLLLIDDLTPLLWDCSEPQRARTAATLEWLLRRGRKIGIATVLRTADVTLARFAGLDALRQLAVSANLLALTSRVRLNGLLIPGLAGDPTALPLVWPDGAPATGLGYSLSRYAPLRTYLASP